VQPATRRCVGEVFRNMNPNPVVAFRPLVAGARAHRSEKNCDHEYVLTHNSQPCYAFRKDLVSLL